MYFCSFGKRLSLPFNDRSPHQCLMPCLHWVLDGPCMESLRNHNTTYMTYWQNNQNMTKHPFSPKSGDVAIAVTIHGFSFHFYRFLSYKWLHQRGEVRPWLHHSMKPTDQPSQAQQKQWGNEHNEQRNTWQHLQEIKHMEFMNFLLSMNCYLRVHITVRISTNLWRNDVLVSVFRSKREVLALPLKVMLKI